MVKAISVGNEAPQVDSPLEWWFLQGYYENTRINRQYFMACLFRYHLAQKTASRTNCFSLFVSVLDHKSGKHKTSCTIDNPTLNGFFRDFPKWEKLNIDKRWLRAFREEIRRSGKLRHVSILEQEVLMNQDGLGFHWDDFRLTQSDGEFALTFREPQSGHLCQFVMTPRSPRLDVQTALDIKLPPQPMGYICYPRLKLRGTVEGAPVKGEVWFDHQWGYQGFLVSTRHSQKVLKWDWFGINLEDGSDLIIFKSRDSKSRKVLKQFALWRWPNGQSQYSRKFSCKPLRIWQSSRTAIRYPVEWLIQIPELKARLTYSPYVDDQEIAIFGPMRAVWEGAGQVSGTSYGRKIQGRAQCELHGYGYLFDFRDFMKAHSIRINNHIEEFLPKRIRQDDLQKYVGPPSWKHEPGAYTQMLSQPFWDLVSRSGKRWRPIFGLLLLDALGYESRPFEPLVSNLAELCHTGALIIDDIEDSSKIRRGGDCIHLRYGQDIAINAANTLYFLPSLLIFNHSLLSEKQRLEIHETMTRQYVRAHFGQALDLYWTRCISPENLDSWMTNSIEPKILQMYEFKTSALLEALAETAAIIAQTSAPVRRACIHFARTFGVAFQIMDDIRNFAPSPHWRKISGEDLTEGKMTYVLYRALKNLSGRERERLRDILGSKERRTGPKGFREGLELIHESKALPQSERRVRALAKKAWMEIAETLPSSETKILLKTLCQCLLDLKFEFN